MATTRSSARSRQSSGLTLDGLNKAPTRLDLNKLDFVTKPLHGRRPTTSGLFGLFLARPEASGLSDAVKARIRTAMPALQDPVGQSCRAGGTGQIPPPTCAPSPWRANWRTRSMRRPRDGWRRWRRGLDGLGEWSEAAIKGKLTQFAAQNGIGMGKIGPVLGAVLTGGASSPDIALVLCTCWAVMRASHVFENYAAEG